MTHEKSKFELPIGTRRFILAALLITGWLGCVFMDIKTPEQLGTMVGIVIGFFFGGHDLLKKV